MMDDRDRDFVHFITRKRVWRPLRPSWRDPMTKAQLIDIGGWLEANVLEKSDRFGMADQVEVRTPFLRKRVVRAALDLPPEAKFDVPRVTGKLALREAFADAIPCNVLTREKQGFPCPLNIWLRGRLGEELRGEATWAVADAWDTRYEQELWTRHLSGKEDWGQQLWRLAVVRS
jgi:asparagine synthase (glutamine-hydrolysing)